MRTLGTLSLVVLSFAFTGCQSGSTGGPGADSSGSSHVSTPDDTFTLGKTDVSIHQGESKVVSIPIDRAKNFEEDVKLSFADLPKGVTIDDRRLMIQHGAPEAHITFTAAGDAALGEFTTKLTGHPTRGADAVSDVKITVLPRTPAHD